MANKKILSVLFPNNIDGYLDFKERFKKDEDLLELMLCCNESVSEFETLNWLIRLSKGKYICVITEKDKPFDNFIDEVMVGMSANKDLVVFNSINQHDEIVKHTSLIRGFGLQKPSENGAKPIKHFHMVKNRLANMVLFREDYPYGAYSFYSKKIHSIAFSEHLIRKELIKSEEDV